MDQIKEFLTRKNIIALLIIAVLAAGLLVGVRLVQQQTQLKSKAATECVQQRDPDCSGSDIYCWCRGCTILQAGCTYKHYSNDVWQCEGGSFCSANVTEYVPPGGSCSTITQCVAPPPPPPTGRKFTIGGRVTNKGTGLPIGSIIINQGASPGSNNKECNIGIATTDSNGRYSIPNVDSGTLFCLRSPQVTGYTKGETAGGAGSYESQTASTDKNDYDFVYTPGDDARAEEFKIFGPNRQDVTTTGTIIPGQKYNFEIQVKNTGPSTWKKGIYKLKAAGSTKNDWQLETDSFDYTSPDGDVTKDNIAFFEVEGIAPEISGDLGSKRFEMVMYNGSANFALGVVNRSISIRKSAGGPDSTTGVRFSVRAGGSVQLIPGGPSKTTDVTVTREDSNTGAPSVTVTAIGFPSGVTFSFDQFAETNRSSRTCTPTIQSPCNLNLTMKALTSAPTSTITVRGTFGEVSSSDEFGLVVGATTTAFNFSITKPSDATLTKGQSDSGRDITVSRTAGDAEDVSLSVIGDIGGAVAIFRPSDSCKPDSDNRCQRVLAFDTSRATPGDYSPVIEGRGTGGRIQQSLPFRLKINPAGAVVTCFVVSENRNTRDLFKNCAQSTIDNVSNGVAGFLEASTSLADFQLSAQNGNKTLYARFLKLPQGESITTCTPDKCKDTQAGITLNMAAPPVTGCACQADNTCSSPCQFTKLTAIEYANPISCFTPARIHNVIPNTQDKNSYCNRQRRTEGDANADGRIDIDDYLYYLTAVSGGKVPVSVNPDFDGNGDVGPNDLTIWERSRP